MSWNHRVVHRVMQRDGQEPEHWFGIHEAFYHHQGDTEPHSITVDPVAPGSDTLDGLRLEMEMFMLATSKQTLEWADFDKVKSGKI